MFTGCGILVCFCADGGGDGALIWKLLDETVVQRFIAATDNSYH